VEKKKPPFSEELGGLFFYGRIYATWA
jgi:hypothetical protein